MRQEDVILAFSRNLRARRREIGITQTELARRIGYSPKSVSKWESGDGVPSAALLPVIAGILKTDVNSLLRVSAEPRYFLGIDGGGTKTEFLLCDRRGRTVGGSTLLGCNPNDVGSEKCREILRRGCEEVCGGIPFGQVSVFAGIAGALTAGRAELTAFLYSLGFLKARCESDTGLAAAATLGGADGVCAIMGTGIIVIARKDGKTSTVGGFNYFFDRGGSGFNIGRDAVLYALLCEERGGEKTPLYNAVLKKCGTAAVYGNLTKFYAQGKRYVAEFAPSVFGAYESDGAARRIIADNMSYAGEMISYALSVTGARAVHITGGLCAHADILEAPLRESITRPCKLIFHNASLAEYALRLAGSEETPC